MSDLKLYFVYAGDQYYPKIAMGDFIDSFKTIEEAEAYAKILEDDPNIDWVRVVDISYYIT